MSWQCRVGQCRAAIRVLHSAEAPVFLARALFRGAPHKGRVPVAAGRCTPTRRIGHAAISDDFVHTLGGAPALHAGVDVVIAPHVQKLASGSWKRDPRVALIACRGHFTPCGKVHGAAHRSRRAARVSQAAILPRRQALTEPGTTGTV
ncbi:hypothetical protein DIPPA_57801 [Diplonema papillatum]|nr:hypothetical protein DIPPA_57801 [Diplonema papillatum]